MPIDFSSTTKSAERWAYGSPFLNKILGSSVFVAGAVSFLMIMLIMVMYPARSGTSFSIVLKMFVYMFFGSLLVIFMHDGFLRHMTEESHTEKQSEAFMQNITQSGRAADPSYASMYKPITPSTETTTTTSSNPVQVVVSVTPPSQPAVVPIPTTFVEDKAVLGGAPPKWKAKPVSANPYK